VCMGVASATMLPVMGVMSVGSVKEKRSF